MEIDGVAELGAEIGAAAKVLVPRDCGVRRRRRRRRRRGQGGEGQGEQRGHELRRWCVSEPCPFHVLAGDSNSATDLHGG